MRKKGTDQPRGFFAASQRLFFRYIVDSTIPLISMIRYFPSPVAPLQPFVSDLVGNPVDRLSRNAALLVSLDDRVHKFNFHQPSIAPC